MTLYPVGIIGAGPAGIAAAIQLQRSGISPLILERDQIGGLLRNANWVENYPGFPRGISGIKLTQLFSRQARKVGVNITYAEANRVEYQNEGFFIHCSEHSFNVQRLLIASGTKYNLLTEPDIPAKCRSAIFYEVYPLFNTTDCTIVILGAGDAAFDYALNLAKRNRVILLNRGSEIKCLDLLFQRAMQTPQITYLTDITIARIEPNNDTALKLTCNTLHKTNYQISADYLVVAIGRSPQLDFLPHQFMQIMDGLIQQGRLYLIGDVVNGLDRQTGIAVGDGLRAAMSILHQKTRDRQ